MQYNKDVPKLVSLIELETHLDNRGQITVADLPFQPKRMYTLSGMSKETIRCLHAHKSLVQLMFCLSGSFKLTSPLEEESFLLNSQSSVAVLIPAGLWRRCSEFSEDCLVMVLASEKYEKSDYIYDFEEYVLWYSSRSTEISS